MRRRVSTLVRPACVTLAVLVSVVAAGCSGGTPTASTAARPDASVMPIWTAPPSGVTPPPTAVPSASASPALDAASSIELTGTYRLVYRPNDTSLTDSFTAGLSTSGLKPRAASREVWDDTGHVGGMVVIDLLGMDLPDDALTSFATTFASQASADLTWKTAAGRRVAVITQGDQRLELFLLAGDLVVVAGVQPSVADGITQALIEQNA